MTDADARPTRYRWAGRDEWMLVSDSDNVHHVLIVQPLFAELNRTRRLLRDVMRALRWRGIGSTLPDLPGLGESARPLADIAWADWRGALAGAAAKITESVTRLHVASFRGGALLDHELSARSHWRMSPVTGAAALRDLRRTQTIGGGAALGGYRPAAGLIAALEAAAPMPATALRTVRLDSSTEPGDAIIAGPALWRRAEPGPSPALAEAIAGDIAGWIARCDG